MIPVEEAFELIDKHVDQLPNEKIQLEHSVGRVLAASIQSDVDSPPHDKSMMDGFAVRSSDIDGDPERKFKIVETVIAGDLPTIALEEQQATRIMTGAPIPKGADAVVMIERANLSGSGDSESVTFDIDSIRPEKHILRRGVNFSNGQDVFHSGHVVRPTDIGLLAEVGANEVSVGGKPSIAVLPTGNELVSCDQIPEHGQIRNSNGPLLAAMTRGLGIETTDLGVGRDEPEQLKSLIQQGLNHQLLILSGGVSAGTMDLVPGILQELGVQQIFHKVCVKPGKPVWFGILEQDGKQTCVFGLPGNPVSSLVGFQLFVRAAIRKMASGNLDSSKTVMAELSKDHETRGNRPTYWPGKLVPSDSAVRKVEPLIWRGSSDLFALGQAEGLIYFPANSQLHCAGEVRRFHPF